MAIYAVITLNQYYITKDVPHQNVLRRTLYIRQRKSLTIKDIQLIKGGNYFCVMALIEE